VTLARKIQVVRKQQSVWIVGGACQISAGASLDEKQPAFPEKRPHLAHESSRIR
jgi:hypothetical protein